MAALKNKNGTNKRVFIRLDTIFCLFLIQIQSLESLSNRSYFRSKNLRKSILDVLNHDTILISGRAAFPSPSPSLPLLPKPRKSIDSVLLNSEQRCIIKYQMAGNAQRLATVTSWIGASQQRGGGGGASPFLSQAAEAAMTHGKRRDIRTAIRTKARGAIQAAGFHRRLTSSTTFLTPPPVPRLFATLFPPTPSRIGRPHHPLPSLLFEPCPTVYKVALLNWKPQLCRCYRLSPSSLLVSFLAIEPRLSTPPETSSSPSFGSVRTRPRMLGDGSVVTVDIG